MNANRLPKLVAIIAVTALFGSVSVRADAPKPGRTVGAEVLRLDAATRKNFDRDHPGLLPERKLKLPDANAAAFDWTKYRNVNLHRQGSFGTCWAHAAIEALEWSWAIRNAPGDQPILSVQPILDRTQKNGGGSMAMAMQVLMDHGTTKATAYPYTGEPEPFKSKVPTPYRAIAWGEIVVRGKVPEPAQIKRALLEHGPVVAEVEMSPAFKSYKNGLFSEHYTPPAGTKKSTHAILIVGWDDKRGNGAWKIQNSWGLKWGEGGFMWIEYGSNNIGKAAAWLRAQPTHYLLPSTVHRQLSAEAEPLPRWPGPANLTVKVAAAGR